MKKYFLICVILLTTALAIGTTFFNAPHQVAACEVSGHQDKSSYEITVTGTGCIKTQPDFASINLNIETKNKNLERAQRENTTIVQRLIKVLNEQGISESDINTDWFNIYPEYDHHHHGNNLTAHRVSNQLTIKVRDINNVGKIIDLSTKAGATIVSGVQFGIEKNTHAYNTALVEAIQSAKEKAILVSTATEPGDLKVVSVKEIFSNYSGYDNYYYGRYAYCAGDTNHTSILHNEIKVTATVEVKFKVN